MRDTVIDIPPRPGFPTGKPIDLGGVIVWAAEITYDDPALYERVLRGDLPTYKVFWTPPNITAMTWPG